MKAKSAFSICVLALLLFAAGQASAQGGKTMNSQTQQNLSTAMHGEAFAYAKYMLYAQEARRTGRPELADMLEKTARTERFEHFAEEAKLAGLAGTNSANLEDAIKGESYETEKMYREFTEQAEKAGDHAAARRFEEIGQDEAKHRDAFVAELAKVKSRVRTTAQ